jgi:hypothetical protein
MMIVLLINKMMMKLKMTMIKLPLMMMMIMSLMTRKTTTKRLVVDPVTLAKITTMS